MSDSGGRDEDVGELAAVRAQLAAALAAAEAATRRAEDAERSNAVNDVRAGADFLDLATDELQRSERVLRAIFSGASDAMLLLDDAGRFVDANPAACTLLATTKSTLLRGSVGDYTDSTPEQSRAMFQAFLAAGHLRTEGFIRRVTKERRMVDLSAVANIGEGLHLLVLRDITDRSAAAESLKLKDDELRRSDARFRALVEKSAEAIALMAADGTVLYITNHSLEFFGLLPAEMVGTRAIKWVHREDHALVAELTNQSAETGSSAEFRVVNKHGASRWVECVVTNLLDDPAIGALVLNVRDVEERHREKREREQLIESLTFERGKLGSLLEKAPAFMAILRGHDQVIELANEAYLEFVARQDIVGKRMVDAVPEFGPQGFIDVLERVLETGEPFHMRGAAVSINVPGKRPEIRFVNAQAKALVEADGRRSGVLIHGVNVTEETIAQRRNRAQFNGVPVPTYAWQRVENDGKVDVRLFDFNEAANKLSSGKMRINLGRSMYDIFPGDTGLFADVLRCIEGGETFSRDVERVSTSTQEKRRMVVTFSPAPPDLALAHVEDVTARYTLEEQLRQAQKMEAVGRLAGGVAHDFNNLLSVVLSYTTLALEDLKEDDPMHSDLEQVQLAGERAVELTRQLLAFSRQQVLQPRTMSIRETVLGVEKMLRRLLGEDIELVLRLTSDAFVEADPGQMEQVIMNLAINARDAMPEGGRLTVATEEIAEGELLMMEPVTLAPRPYVSLCVSDSGHGMDDATRARIFEPFFTTKGAGKGTGLGLATVFGIVQQSGGTISVQSAPGETTFRINFPQSMRKSEGTSLAPKVGPASGGTETILVVEDEAPLRALAVAVLRRSGYNVLEASDGEDALTLAAGYDAPIDLLLTDVVMPRVNGRSLSDRLSVARQEMKTLFMSGYTDDAAVLQRVLASRVAFLQKPLTPDTLLRKVREVLDGE